MENERSVKWAIYGSKGWIGGMTVELVKEMFQNDEVYCSDIRVDDTVKLTSELNEVNPTHVISLVGRTHGPGFSTIDYLEQPGKLVENVRDNLYGPLTLAMLCKERGIHLTYIGTGCISLRNGYDRSCTPIRISRLLRSTRKA